SRRPGKTRSGREGYGRRTTFSIWGGTPCRRCPSSRIWSGGSASGSSRETCSSIPSASWPRSSTGLQIVRNHNRESGRTGEPLRILEEEGHEDSAHQYAVRHPRYTVDRSHAASFGRLEAVRSTGRDGDSLRQP